MLWRLEHPDTSYSGSYRAMTPRTWFDQEFGLITSSAIASHILRAYNRNRSAPTATVQRLVRDDYHCEVSAERITDDVDSTSVLSSESSLCSSVSTVHS